MEISSWAGAENHNLAIDLMSESWLNHYHNVGQE